MELDLTNSNLETFPHLSGFEYKKVNASSNSIQVLWDEHMPRGIEELNLDENRLSTDGLLIEWPDTIKTLSLAYNPYRILDIVVVWPTALRVLNISNTTLIEFPTNLPPSLEVLNVSRTYIKQISHLPEGLKELYVNSAELKFLPKRLPPSLEILNASNNSLRNGGLSLLWGSSLKFLDLNYNHLTHPPRRLPNTIEHLNLHLAAGAVSAANRTLMTQAVTTIAATTDAGLLNRVYAAIVLVMSSNDYLIQQ